jgi:cell division protein FtsW (lipid II flippase)
VKVTVATVPRRRTELGLLVLALAITVGAYTLVSLGRTANPPTNLRAFGLAIAAMLLIAHLAVRRWARFAEGTLLPIAAVLNGVGYVFIVRLKPDLGSKQTGWTAVGIAAFVATLVVVKNVRRLEYLRYTFAFVGVILLTLPLIPGVGRELNGSRIWAKIGPVTFQPGEVAKITLVVFFSSYLVEKRELLSLAGKRMFGVTWPEARHLGPIGLAWLGSIAVMILQKDLGSSLLFFALFVVLLWIATNRTIYLAMGMGMFFSGATVAYQAFDHVQTRVSTWIDPWPTANGKGFQLVQSLYAFGTGGISGTGLALGDPARIPAAYNDFIFAAIGEELGLFGTTAVLALFFLLVGAGLRIALRAEVAFDKLLATGLTAILGLQSFIIIGGVTRLVPLTGVTLPFVSYGGSSLVINYVLIALLMRISHDTNERLAGDVPLTRRERRRNRRADRADEQTAEEHTTFIPVGKQAPAATPVATSVATPVATPTPKPTPGREPFPT